MEQPVVTLLKYVSDPVLLEILTLLLERDRTQKELTSALGLTAGAVSRRIDDLEHEGLVTHERRHGAYRLRDREGILRLVQAAAEVASSTAQAKAETASGFVSRVRAVDARSNGGGR